MPDDKEQLPATGGVSHDKSVIEPEGGESAAKGAFMDGIFGFAEDMARRVGDVHGSYEGARVSRRYEVIKQRIGSRLMREYENVERIAQGASERMSGSDAEKEEKIRKNITPDWSTNFYEQAKNVSDEDIRVLWEKVLMGEAEKRNSFSKRTLRIIGDMEKKDAEMFTHFCQFVVKVNPMKDMLLYPIIYNDSHSVYDKKFQILDMMEHFASIGLLAIQLTGFSVANPTAFMQFYYHGSSIYMKLFPNKQYEGRYVMDMGKVMLTQAGLELFAICNATPNWKFWEYLQEEWKKKGYEPSPTPHPQ